MATRSTWSRAHPHCPSPVWGRRLGSYRGSRASFLVLRLVGWEGEYSWGQCSQLTGGPGCVRAAHAPPRQRRREVPSAEIIGYWLFDADGRAVPEEVHRQRCHGQRGLDRRGPQPSCRRAARALRSRARQEALRRAQACARSISPAERRGGPDRRILGADQIADPDARSSMTQAAGADMVPAIALLAAELGGKSATRAPGARPPRPEPDRPSALPDRPAPSREGDRRPAREGLPRGSLLRRPGLRNA